MWEKQLPGVPLNQLLSSSSSPEGVASQGHQGAINKAVKVPGWETDWEFLVLLAWVNVFMLVRGE